MLVLLLFSELAKEVMISYVKRKRRGVRTVHILGGNRTNRDWRPVIIVIGCGGLWCLFGWWRSTFGLKKGNKEKKKNQSVCK